MDRQQLLKYIISPENLNAESLLMFEEMINKYPYFSIGQLLYLKNLHKMASEKFADQLKITAIYSPDRAKLKEILFGISEETESKRYSKYSGKRPAGKSQSSIDELIDRFIKEEPRISKAGEKPIIQLEIPEQDESSIFDIATETLAKVYLKQGNKNMAVKIYNQLILKFPEKSSYFAAQIQKINKEDINNK